MREKNAIMKILKEELPYLKQEYNVKSVGVFGSWVRGEQTVVSDLDVLVDFIKPIGFFRFMELEDYLSEKLKVKADLVTPDALKPLIKTQVLEEAIFV
ncbi:MAG: nucleotidyltransferase family protein [Candidatus Hodarchaeota archaeon]